MDMHRNYSNMFCMFTMMIIITQLWFDHYNRTRWSWISKRTAQFLFSVLLTRPLRSTVLTIILLMVLQSIHQSFFWQRALTAHSDTTEVVTWGSLKLCPLTDVSKYTLRKVINAARKKMSLNCSNILSICSVCEWISRPFLTLEYTKISKRFVCLSQCVFSLV